MCSRLLLATLTLATTTLSCTPPAELAVAEEPPGAFAERTDETALTDDFASAELDGDRWVRTKQHDFSEEAIEVVDGRLRMAAATMDTDPETVKFHGVRTSEPVVDLSGDVTIEFELDWNDQANGCYMRAGIYLCPTVSENPREEDEWLRMIYVGVPPGRSARAWISRNVAGNEQAIMTENWPQEREGRQVGKQRVAITLEGETMTVVENGETIYSGPRPEMGFDRAYLYLLHSSHSNYSLREVYFDNVRVCLP